MKHIVSFSGGKDSTAMLLMMIEKGIRIDEIIFCDTGVEFDELYDHISKVEEYIGRKITKLKADNSFEWYLLERPKRTGGYGYGFPTVRARWCTKYLKTDVYEKYIKEKYGENYKSYIGLAYDEQERIQKNTDERKLFPLNEWKITEKQALEFCYEKGFDWGGLYKLMDRVSCWCCPLKSIPEIRKLYYRYPDKWKQLKEWDSKVEFKFKRFAYMNAEKFETRFKFEEERINEGKSIRSKDFFIELKERYRELKGGG